jgi:hypothetical protein
MATDYPHTLYRHHDAGAAAPSDDARWAITDQEGAGVELGIPLRRAPRHLPLRALRA